jgi:hypothetical protein
LRMWHWCVSSSGYGATAIGGVRNGVSRLVLQPAASRAVSKIGLHYIRSGSRMRSV